MLGELQVLADGEPVALGGAKQRSLLAALLIERGKTVSIDRLIEQVWPLRPPDTAQKSVQVYVSGLRRALGEERIMTRGRGYQLVAGPDEVDLDRFDELVRAAAGTAPERAARQLRDALQLVRGRPLADVEFEPWAAPEAARIEERILDATEARIEADLALGRHAELVNELETLAATYPYREHLLELSMLALYRSGRQVDALAAYRRGAAHLRDELGLAPGRALQQLESAILRQDPALDAPLPAESERVRTQTRRSRRLALTGALAVAVAIVAATVVLITRDDTASLESLPPGVAILSASDGSLVAHISTEAIPFPSEVLTGDENFWVWSLQPFSMVEIHAQTGEIGRRVGSPFSGDADGFTVDGRDIWFAGARDLVRVDSGSGKEVDRFRLTRKNHYLGLGPPGKCAGQMWVANNAADVLMRVNPETGAIAARIPMPSPWGIACGGGAVWVTSNSAGDVRRVDTLTNHITGVAQTPSSSSITYGAGFAWSSSEAGGTVYKIDRRGRVVTTYETGDGARQLSFGGGKLWVANQDDGTVTGIDAATGATTTYGFGHPVQSVAVLGSNLLVELVEGLTFEDRISALKGDVARLIVPTYVFDPPDPALARNRWAFMVEQATCAGLVARPPGAGGRVVPDLAAALPKVSADGRLYTFTLRGGVRFAPPSNAVVTAEDVRASIERALSSRLGSDQPGIHFLGDILGAQALHRRAAVHARGISVRGNRISITLARPSATFLERLALPFFCTVP
ncbi:MAG: hypothetical protein QOK36_221, partial [Gaiellales bacterium]|nr:hypothetical protein [Gaiellales bacterium]